MPLVLEAVQDEEHLGEEVEMLNEVEGFATVSGLVEAALEAVLVPSGVVLGGLLLVVVLGRSGVGVFGLLAVVGGPLLFGDLGHFQFLALR